MMRLLRFLIWGDAHQHKWASYGQVTCVYGEKDDKDGTPRRRQQSFQCETCGKIRIFEV